MKPLFVPDVRAEFELTRLGVNHTNVEIQISQIDWVESQVNGARIGKPLVRELIEDYKQAFKAGDAFPRLVVCASKRARHFIILWGNQRSTALRELIDEKVFEADSPIACHHVDTDDQMMREIIARIGNVAHGGRSSRDERIQHAMYCVRSLSMTSTQASTYFNIPISVITTHLRSEETRRHLQRAGINADEIPMASLDSIRRIPDDSIKEKLGHLVALHLPNSDRVRDLTNKIRREGTVQERLNHVIQFEKELAAQSKLAAVTKANPRAPRRPKRDQLLSLLEKLNAFLGDGGHAKPYGSLSDIQFSGGDDVTRAKSLWSNIRRRMDIIVKGDS